LALTGVGAGVGTGVVPAAAAFVVDYPLEFVTVTVYPVTTVAVVTVEFVVYEELDTDPVTVVYKLPDDQVQLFG
jgi:hypothetical protein